MDVFDYIGNSNPKGAQGVIEDYGYRMVSKDMGYNLRRLMDETNGAALDHIMTLHPDSDYLRGVGEVKSKKKSSCGCGNCAPRRRQRDALNYVYADGSPSATAAATTGNQMGMALIAVSLIFAVAIISKAN